MQSEESYRDTFNAYLAEQFPEREPGQLYAPMRYILGSGGKRLRPLLLLMVADALGGNFEQALPAALAFEIFHNFSLVHDDIMDAAPLRRGRETIHEKWDANTAILSGDAMLIRSYQLFAGYDPPLYKSLVELFSQTALEVCEGQQYDIDFATRETVGMPEYLHMIRCKTAVLLAACVKAGAMVAGAQEAVQQAGYEFGIHLGQAFQLQDDYLDAFGDPGTFGKQTGGDIIENKKTFLYLVSLEHLEPDAGRELEHLYSVRPADSHEKIERVKELFGQAGAGEMAKEAVEQYTRKAFESLRQMGLGSDDLSQLLAFGQALMHRMA